MAETEQHHRAVSAALLLAATALVSSCGIREVGLADRCAEVMEQAFPGGKFKVTKAEAAPDAAAASVSAMVAQVAAVRTDVPAEGVLARDVAVECRFEGNILTQFRWTKGPLQPPSTSP